MSSSKRNALFWVSAWLPVLVAIALVAIESTPYFGADRTSGPLRHIWEWIFGPVSDYHWHYLHLAFRKSGHFGGFGLVGLTWLRAWWKTLPNAPLLRIELLAMIGTALVASGDEYHQSFLPNRSSSVRDVALDCIGALFMMAIVHIYIKMKAPGRLAKAAA